MKKIIPLKKDLDFKDNLAEVTSISLEHDLNLKENNVIGQLIIMGTYKINDTSVNVENFNFNVPVNIEISDKYILDKLTIDIDDFFYEVIDNTTLSVSVDIALDNLLEKEENKMEEREEIEEVETTDEVEIIEENEEERCIDTSDVKTLFESFDDTLETYSTYKVCIVKEGDTIDSIMLSYNITRESLEQYNDLSEIKIGDKIIIPTIYEKN